MKPDHTTFMLAAFGTTLLVVALVAGACDATAPPPNVEIHCNNGYEAPRSGYVDGVSLAARPDGTVVGCTRQGSYIVCWDVKRCP
jgi:hypothetical protein